MAERCNMGGEIHHHFYARNIPLVLAISWDRAKYTKGIFELLCTESHTNTYEGKSISSNLNEPLH